jgi:hypothetical protein
MMTPSLGAKSSPVLTVGLSAPLPTGDVTTLQQSGGEDDQELFTVASKDDS